jgi:YaiO family outer membrane protein
MNRPFAAENPGVMLLSLLLTGLLTASAEQVSQTPATREAAIELAQSGEYDEALDTFRRVAAANPRDIEARLWIARLHVWMGHPDRAEPVFRSVLLENPSSIDARLGVGVALVSLNRADEALEVLEPAEQLAPNDPEVLAALGRAHRLAGNTSLSLGYLERAAAMAPTMDNRLSLEQTRMLYDHRVESTSYVEDFSLPVANTASTDFLANVRISDRLRVIGRGQFQRKFSESEQRGGLGIEWRWDGQTTMYAQALVGPGNTVLPRTDANLEVGHIRGAAEWVAGVRFIDFAGASVTVLSPGATWWPRDRVSFGLRYSLAMTNFDDVESQTGHSATLRGSYMVYPRVWLNAGYSTGVENFDNLSPDRVGDFRANTASGGVRIDLPTFTSVFGIYEHQRRANDIKMNRVTVALVQRF